MAPEETKVIACEKCGATARLHNGVCVNCLLREGLEAANDVSRAVFESAITEVNVPDKQWRLGDYEILDEIGRGGMGVIYRAIDTTLQREVALKLIRIGVATRSTEARERFLREARASAALRHEHIATVFQFGICEVTGQFFYAMELIEGETLEERVQRSGPLSVRTTIDIAQQVSSALTAAEKRTLVHRDLKPSNLMLVWSDDEEGGAPIVKIIDFGLAKVLNAPLDPMRLTHGGFVGTPAFASPEQFENSALDVRSDIYSLGTTLWFTLTGKTPFGGRGLDDIRRAQQSDVLPIEQLKVARVPSRLRSLLKSMLAFEPAARPRTRELTMELQRCAAEASGERRARIGLAAAAILTLGASAILVFFSVRNGETPMPRLDVEGSPPPTLQNLPSNPAAPEKSIAVLPFENQSQDKQNAYFADGIQDEILTHLSKIADLKVISRTSTQKYKSAPGNLREIARQLGVSNILEGSVQKAADRVRVNVQLINALNDAHLWSDIYDRKLTDIFAVESDIAKGIADQLRAKLTGWEEQVIAAKPTDKIEAYDAYLRGLAYTMKSSTPANMLDAQKYLKEAVHLDPNFGIAWALLSYVDARGYKTLGLQPTAELREEIRQAAETALTLQPNLGEAVLANGQYYYACLKDYDTAVRYFEKARQLLPNNSRIPESLAYVMRRQGQWERSESYFNEAERLDPRNANLLAQHALSYINLRRFPEALRKLDQVLNIIPDDVDTLALEAAIAQAEGDLPRAAALLAPLRPTADLNEALETQVYQGILERLPGPIIPRLKEVLTKPDPALGYINGELRFWLGWAQQVAGDHTAAQGSWRQARSELESFLKDQPENGRLIGDLALTDAGLGEKAAALALAERAIAVNPIEKDAVFGPMPIEILARVAAEMRESDRAIAALQKLLLIPYGGLRDAGPLTPAVLRLDPMFDTLRNDPRFQKLCEEKQPPALDLANNVPEKSIAVLPFENLSGDPNNAYFADGIEEEILTRLDGIAELKVISRTSTQQYESKPRNLREIAKQLGVAHLVEGSVQKLADQVRVNAQLINAQTDSHLWAETYDRKLTDIFGVESEIARRIAESLQAKLTGREEQALAVKPTNNPEAYDAYLRGLTFEGRTYYNNTSSIREAAGSYERAVQLDPNFAIAWARLSRADSFMDNDYGDPVRRNAAKRALENAQRLAPESPETLFALGLYQHRVLRDYGLAKTTFERVSKMLPGNSEAQMHLGAVARRQGNWNESIAYFEKALVLDPRNTQLLMLAAQNYACSRQFSAMLKLYDRALDIVPNDLDIMAAKASIYQAQGNLPEAASLLSQTNEQTANGETVLIKVDQLRLERNYAEIVRLLQARLAQGYFDSTIDKAHDQVALALTQRLADNMAGAKVTAEAARNTFELLCRDQPENAFPAADLSQAYAAMGQKDPALEAAQRAIMLQARTKDRASATAFEENLALIQTMFGDTGHAISTLAQLLHTPSRFRVLYNMTPITPALLRLDPIWDPLRGDPAFQKLCEEKQK